MADETIELGQATIEYEGPDDDPVRKTVPNEHIAYFQDHWIIKVDEEDSEADLVRRIPAHRVYSVERSVEEFEEEVATRLDQVQSFVEDLQTKIPIGGRRSDESRDVAGQGEEHGGGGERIEIDLGDDDDEDDDTGGDTGTEDDAEER